MTEETPLDGAHARMEAEPENEAARLGFYQALADAELYLLLAGEPVEGQIEPEMLEIDGARYALVFDTDWRLANFTQEHLPGEAMPYAALPGRVVAQLLKDQNVGLGLNLDVGPSSILIPPEAVSWLASALTTTPEESTRAIVAIEAPGNVPDTLIPALVAKLAPRGLALGAALASARLDDGSTVPMVGFVGPAPGAEEALAKAVQEALMFTGIEDFTLEVGFFAPRSPEAEALLGLGHKIPLPPPPAPEETQATPPGSDPSRPPILKG